MLILPFAELLLSELDEFGAATLPGVVQHLNFICDVHLGRTHKWLERSAFHDNPVFLGDQVVEPRVFHTNGVVFDDVVCVAALAFPSS